MTRATVPLVFIVDDDPSVRKSLVRLIRSAGYEVEAFASAEDFLSRFGANHIHAVPGDRRAEVRAACELLGVTLDEFSRG